MQLSRVLRIAACLAGLTAMSAVCFAAPTLPAHARARAGSECQADKPEPKSLAFVVRYVERRPAGEFILTFENGEIWQQDDPTNKEDDHRARRTSRDSSIHDRRIHARGARRPIYSREAHALKKIEISFFVFQCVT